MLHYTYRRSCYCACWFIVVGTGTLREVNQCYCYQVHLCFSHFDKSKCLLFHQSIILWGSFYNCKIKVSKHVLAVMDYYLPQPWVCPRNHFGISCGKVLRAVGLCCQGLLRHHQTRSRMTDCSNNIPPPVQSKVKSPSMTRQPWLIKAVIDYCTGK